MCQASHRFQDCLHLLAIGCMLAEDGHHEARAVWADSEPGQFFFALSGTNWYHRRGRKGYRFG